MGIFPIGVPVVFAVLLWSTRHSINPPGGESVKIKLLKRSKDPRAKMTSFLWNTYKPGTFVFTLCDFHV